MPHIVITSKNPVKINSILEGFRRMFPEETFTHAAVSVSSGVSDQPKSIEETILGALNRINQAKSIHSGADYYASIEGGIQTDPYGIGVQAWAASESRDGRMGKGASGIFYLPPAVVALLQEGKELSLATDILFKKTNSGHEMGAVGVLTDNQIDRTEFNLQAVIFALIPHKKKELFPTQ